MTSFRRVALISVVAICCGLAGIAQQPEKTASLKGAGLVNLKQPVYPPLARQANIYGDVLVTVTVEPDGKTEVALESGHQMLTQAALDSAKQSQFVCRECDTSATYHLVYSFRLTRGGDCCSAFSVTPQVTEEPESPEQNGQPQMRIAITAEEICLCDPGATLTKRSRSAKCLYLWRCS
jgi:TonB family protein